jgi:hypothetical protein
MVRVVLALIGCGPGMRSGLAFVMIRPTVTALAKMRGKRVAALSHME